MQQFLDIKTRDTDKMFEIPGNLLKLITNTIHAVDLDNLSD